MIMKPNSISPLPSQKFIYLVFIVEIIFLIDRVRNYLKNGFYPPWLFLAAVIFTFLALCRLPRRRSSYEICTYRMQLIYHCLKNRYWKQSSPIRAPSVYNLCASFAISIDVSPISVSDVLESEVFALLLQYMNRFGLTASLMSLEFDCRDGDWQLQVHYSYNIEANYRIIMTKQNDYPVYSTGVAQLQRLQNDLQAMSFASHIVTNSFTDNNRIVERWNHILDADNEKHSIYITRDKSYRFSDGSGFLEILDACFQNPDTRKIMLHCHSYSCHSLKVIGIVTIKQESSPGQSRSILQRIKDTTTGNYGRVPGLYLCAGEQCAALYSYDPKYILSRISPEHRDFISVPYTTHFVK